MVDFRECDCGSISGNIRAYSRLMEDFEGLRLWLSSLRVGLTANKNGKKQGQWVCAHYSFTVNNNTVVTLRKKWHTLHTFAFYRFNSK